MIVFGSMHIQTNESLLWNQYDQLFAFYKKNWIQNTINLINYTWNIVKNLIVIDLPVKIYLWKFNKITKRYIYNVDVSKILIGQYNPSNEIIITVSVVTNLGRGQIFQNFLKIHYDN